MLLPMVGRPAPASASGMQAEDPAPGPAAEPENYIVQPGDWLGQIANRFGIPWERLAETNDLRPPYVLYPGQEIRLR